MGLERWFGGSRPARDSGERLYGALVDQARTPAFYAAHGVPDTLEGRFEVYALHLALLVLRLKGEGEQAGAVSQALFDRFVTGLDDGLRQMGVADTGLKRRMKPLGQALYGRLHAYHEALAALPDRAALDALVSRTALPDGEGDPAALAAYVERAQARLAATPLEQLVAGTVEWPEAAP